MLVAVLIGIMISIVVGVSLIPTILSGITSVNDTVVNSSSSVVNNTTVWVNLTVGGTLPGLMGLINVLPYVFVAVILLGAVAWIGGQG